MESRHPTGLCSSSRAPSWSAERAPRVWLARSGGQQLGELELLEGLVGDFGLSACEVGPEAVAGASDGAGDGCRGRRTGQFDVAVVVLAQLVDQSRLDLG